MAKVIVMPKMGNTVESVIIGEIFIKVGDVIKTNQKLFEYETDKSTTEYNSEIDGEVLAILMEDGEEVEVLKNIIVVGKKGEDISEFIKENKEKPEVQKDEVIKENKITTNQNEVNTQIATTGEPNGPISPRASKLSSSLEVDKSQVVGTGVKGRIVEEDVLKYYHSNVQRTTESGQPNVDNLPEFNRIEYTPTRKAIANALRSSLQKGAQLTLGLNFDASAILKLRSEIKLNFESLGIENSSINDIIVFALSRVLPRFPHINALMSPEGEYYSDQYNVAHIAIAVDAPKGLITPVVKNASSMTLNEITRTTKSLFAKAKEGKLKMADITGGTFTITNLGLSGVSFFTPIVNPPQSAILGVGSPTMRLRFDKDKNIQEYPEITLSLTMDHAPNDGAAGSMFLKELKKVLENINVLFL